MPGAWEQNKKPIPNERTIQVAVAELIGHKRRSKKFDSSIENVIKTIKNEDTDETTAAICVDYMANVSLPTIPVQYLYYLRQLTVNASRIHDFVLIKWPVLYTKMEKLVKFKWSLFFVEMVDTL